MKTSPYVDALLEDLAVITGDTDRRLAAALRGTAGLRLLEALSEAAGEISELLPGGHVEVRLAGPDPVFVYVEEVRTASAPPADEPATARISLRLPEWLKAQVEALADQEGVSVNTWLVRVATRAISGAGQRLGTPGTRLKGFAQG